MFLLAFVILLEVIFAILPSFVGEITTSVAQYLLAVSDAEMVSRKNISSLKEEQAQLSITDEFVRYAKLQRQIDKLMLTIKEKGSERKHHVYYLRLSVTVGMYVLHAVFVVALLYQFYETSLLDIDPSWVAPLGRVVAFPTGVSGSLGLGCWLFVSNSVISRIKSLTRL